MSCVSCGDDVAPESLLPIMSLELDLEFRSAVFAHVQRLRELGGGVVTRAMLDEGIQFRGERQPIWNRYTGIFRPAILREPGAA